MIKIAYYTEVDLGFSDGPAVNELEFVNSLSQLHDHDYLICVPAIDALKGRNIISLGSPPRISNMISWIDRYRLIHKKIKEQEISLLVCRLPDYPIVPLLIKLFNPKIKLAIKTGALWWVGRTESHSIKDKFYNLICDWLTRCIYKLSDAVDVAMPETMNTLIKHGLITKDKTILVDNAINIDLFKPSDNAVPKKELNIPKNATVLGFIGSLPSQRGASQILKTAEKLNGEVKDLYVIIVGYDEKIEELINNSSFPQEKIIFPGKIPYSDVPSYLSCITIAYSFFEPHKILLTGNASQKVKQYIAMGKPVISVKTGHEYLKKNRLGSPVDQENIQEIVDETVKWIKIIEEEGEDLAKRLHQYAKEHLSTEKTFQQRLEFWQSILNNEK